MVDVCNVSIHVVNVVSVGWVLHNVPFVRLRALGGEHVATVLGLVIYTVKGCDLQRGDKVREQEWVQSPVQLFRRFPVDSVLFFSETDCCYTNRDLMK